jgi:hypothetical protein
MFMPTNLCVGREMRQGRYMYYWKRNKEKSLSSLGECVERNLYRNLIDLGRGEKIYTLGTMSIYVWPFRWADLMDLEIESFQQLVCHEPNYSYHVSR